VDETRIVEVAATPDQAAPAPVAPEERISAVDVLRGFALLGILLMNIEGFGLPDDGLADVRNARSPLDPDRLTWVVVAVLFEGKMRALFSMLFGAGVILYTERASRRGDSVRIADLYYRRTLWLLAFGLVHAYFIWSGDILYSYALGGLLLFPFRTLSARALIASGVIMLAVTVPAQLLKARHLERARALAAEARAAEKAGKPLSREQRKARDEWKDALDDARPDPGDVAEEVEAHRGGYWKLFQYRRPDVVEGQSRSYYTDTFWDTTGMMLVGMGLMKLGVFAGTWPPRFYGAMAALGLGIGLPTFMAMILIADDLEPVAVARALALYQPGRLASALGYAGLVLLVVRRGWLRPLTARLAAVGRMALSNYLGTSVACSILFDGYGFGLFGRLHRHQLYGVVLAIWAVQLVVSPIWLRRFRFGPVEWLWRSLTYGKPQPMRLARGEAARSRLG
jgi:uncharacterized protein